MKKKKPMNKLFIDFDGVYENTAPPLSTIVITDSYDKPWAIRVSRKVQNRKRVYEEFLISMENTSEIKEEHLMTLFTKFFFPLGRWIKVITELVEKGDFDIKGKVVFSSFSLSKKVFSFEAEGEVNSQFLYHGSYFLSSYLKDYLVKIGVTSISINKKRTRESTVLFWLRNILVLNMKFVQLSLYKIFTFKRFYGNSKPRNKPTVFLSRALIQSQFVKGVYVNNISESYMLVNESSTYPFRNLKFAKKTILPFFYAEGFLTTAQLFKLYIKSIRNYFTNYQDELLFYGVQVKVSDLLKDFSILNSHFESYSISVANALRKLKYNISEKTNVVCFEMLSPFAVYKIYSPNIISY